MSEQSQEKSDRKILGTVDHPIFGKVVDFEDSKGIGMQVGEGENSFIVRPSRPGHVVVEGAITEQAKQIAEQLMGKAIDRRGGHL